MTKASSVKIVTANGAHFTARLCDHWRNKFPIDQGERWGVVSFPSGDVRFASDATSLIVTVTTRLDNELQSAKSIIADRLSKVSDGELFAELDWLDV